MILVDTSVWIEHLRGTDDPAALRLAALIDDGAELVTTEPIVMELLAGATTPIRHRAISALADGLPVLSVDPRLDYRAAARLHVASRQNGRPVRSLTDCLIAAVAIRRDAPVLHRDRDFTFLAEIAPSAWPDAGQINPSA